MHSTTTLHDCTDIAVLITTIGLDSRCRLCSPKIDSGDCRSPVVPEVCIAILHFKAAVSSLMPLYVASVLVLARVLNVIGIGFRSLQHYFVDDDILHDFSIRFCRPVTARPDTACIGTAINRSATNLGMGPMKCLTSLGFFEAKACSSGGPFSADRLYGRQRCLSYVNRAAWVLKKARQ